jgi:hypothetical protein
MDVHKDLIVATIQGKDIKTQTKSFKTFTSSLIKLKEWLLNNEVTFSSPEPFFFQDFFIFWR